MWICEGASIRYSRFSDTALLDLQQIFLGDVGLKLLFLLSLFTGIGLVGIEITEN